MPTRRHVQYSSLPTEDRDNLRFTYTPKSHRKIPWKSIALALFLLLIGILLLSLSYFIFTSHVEGDDSQAYGLLFLGVLAFVPGMSPQATSIILYCLSILCLLCCIWDRHGFLEVSVYLLLVVKHLSYMSDIFGLNFSSNDIHREIMHKSLKWSSIFEWLCDFHFGAVNLFSGYYETRVAYYSWKGAPGYTFASIPDY